MNIQLQRLKKTSYLLLFILCLNIFHSYASATKNTPPAEDSSGARALEKKVQTDNVIETISVVGKRPLIALRWEMNKAREDFYTIYNESVSDPSFRVHCNKTRVAGSSLRKTLCVPQYFSDRKAKMTQLRYRYGSLETLDDRDVAAAVKGTREKAMQEMLSLIEQNENVKGQYEHYIESKEKFKNAHVATFGDSSLYAKEMQEEDDEKQGL